MRHLLSNGYFPAELPPPFQSTEYAKFLTSPPPTGTPYLVPKDKTPNYVSRPTTYNLARAGSLRRVLAIPNLINFYQLASLMDSKWSTLDRHYKKSTQALSRPKRGLPFLSGRAFEWSRSFKDIASERSTIRSGMRYSLSVDIKSFYPSIYTHSIAWAMHTKEKAQANTGYHDLLANQFDRLIQNSQSKQTKGIPIGPDTSFLVAELLLSSMDALIKKHVGNRYFRYLDDYEFCFRTSTEADSALSNFQEILGRFELNANEVKTKIEELPAPLESSWLRQLRVFDIASHNSAARQRTDLFDFFNLSIEMWKQFPQESVIRYAVTKTSGTQIAATSWKLYQELLFQWAMAEPAVLPTVLDLLLVYKNNGYGINFPSLEELLIDLISTHAPRGHTSEVAWVLWAHLLFGIKISPRASRIVCKFNNPVIALLALQARKNKLLPVSANIEDWKNKMSASELYGENWLLAYEARIKKWLPPLASKEYVKSADGFGYLGSAGVSFYDESKIKTYSPRDLKFVALKLALRSGSGYA
ncbi:RNA-directed DNA polymerase [Paraburkholderia sp. MPAMCS5]|uniref:RNA-directed DNA polymerase n=1 Tax=Paraburkholderia sp. MPAMCS5 TaxID=3112563 RepID=UPI002E1960DA|nr:RNA-directed DNA polymerase [Paraburkholderia sp. MPAMCS5]